MSDNRVFVDPFLVARQLPFQRVRDRSWAGNHVVTRSWGVLPHRYDRAIYVWAATCAARAPEVWFKFREINDMFGMRWTHEDLAASLERLKTSCLELDLAPQNGMSGDCSVLTTIEKLSLSRRSGQGYVRFGSLFRKSILIPVNAEHLRKLAYSLRKFDLYLWEVTTTAILRDRLPLIVPVKKVLADLVYPDNRKSAFRLRSYQDEIHGVWGTCPHEITKTGLFVLRDGGALGV